ncbi:RHS repeat domain-containing protein, partial [Providencia manganoxydans]
CHFRFAGQFEDNETGLYYNRFRYYDKDSGQYISPDPIGLLGGFNPYGYVHDPVGFIDPFGLACCLPKGFKNIDEFNQFSLDVRNGLSSAGYPSATPIIQGSAVTGKSFRTGEAFDVGRRSDFDIALAGDDIFNAAKNAGIGTRGGGIRTGPLSQRDLKKLGLDKLANDMSIKHGREVNFMIYESASTAMNRAPSIILP